MCPRFCCRLSRALLSAWLLHGLVAGAAAQIVFKVPAPPPPPPVAPAEGPVAEPTELEPRPTSPPETAAPAASAAPAVEAATRDFTPVPVASWFDVQVALAREGYSCGPIDGVGGLQTAAALRAYQEQHDISATGAIDNGTRAQLLLNAPLLRETVLTAEDIATLQPISPTWVGKSQQTALAYETALELIAERFHASHSLIKKLNPGISWDDPLPGTKLTVPNVGKLAKKKKAARVMIELAAHTLQIFDEEGEVIAHFPVSIASRVEKRPAGELHVTVVAPNPDYTFNPEVFPESEEARTLGRKLMIPPGPNNPVGLAWVGLDLPGYGIHGTPRPDQVGRTESHGCFRLANWDALTLLDMVWIGLPVVVLP